MKTERRHELQKNELADSLAHGIERVRPYSRVISGILLGIVALSIAWAYTSNKSARRVTSGWDQYFQAISQSDQDLLVQVAENYAGTPPAVWAKLTLADELLRDGSSRMLVDKREAKERLGRAANNYRGVVSEADEPILTQRASLGLGRTYESLNNLERAREQYQTIVRKWPDSAVAKAAKQRLDDLDKGLTKQFYDWIAKYEPPRTTSQPGSPAGLKPDFKLDNLGPSDIDLPSVIEDKQDRGSSAPATSEPLFPQPDGTTETPAGTTEGDAATPEVDQAQEPPPLGTSTKEPAAGTSGGQSGAAPETGTPPASPK